MTAAAPPAPASVGLDLFAAAIVERFREHHVPILAENDGTVQVWFPSAGTGG